MCGILVLLLYSQNVSSLIPITSDLISALPQPWVNKIYQSILRRGPDGSGERVFKVGGEYHLSFAGSLLHMRGSHPTLQPLTDSRGNCLLFNGEIFSGYSMQEHDNDTQALFSTLTSCPTSDHVLKALAAIRGPWALVFWRQDFNELWFGRDMFGRRSLLIGVDKVSNVPLVLSSVGCGSESLTSRELPTIGVFCLHLKDGAPPVLRCYPWVQLDGDSFVHQEVIINAITQMEQLLDLKVDITSTSSLLAAIPPLNVLTCNPSQPESIPALTTDQAASPLITDKLPYEPNAAQLLVLLQEAVRQRVCNRPWILNPSPPGSPFPPPSVQTEEKGGPDPSLKSKPRQGVAGVGVLFSGGLDSAVLAALADRELPVEEEIDLLNLSFFKSSGDSPVSVAPDRLTGLKCLAQLNPLRKWNFVEIDTYLEELDLVRKGHTSQLIYPLTTVLDDSIGTPVWLGARGLGYVIDKASRILYQSNARILLAGMGADEQLGGYTRHRRAFEQGGWGKLLKEIDLDVRRISHRNLGRDDRCVSDHGKEARFPFLDENVVSFLQNLPLIKKMDLSLPKGVGDKKLLREVATMLALDVSSKLPKRAIQFGTNLVKVTGSNKLKAEDDSNHLEKPAYYECN